MKLICKVVLSLFVASCAVAEAQTTATTDGSGAAGNIPAYSRPFSLTNSPLFAVNGNVGIGTSSPQALLDLYGPANGVNLRLYDSYGAPEFDSTSSVIFAGLDAPNGYVKLLGTGQTFNAGDGLMVTYIAQNYNLYPALWLQGNGNFGIGNAGYGEISILTPNHDSETGEHILNTDPTGYSVLRLGTDSTAAQGSGLHQFGNLWADDPAGATAPSSTSLMAFEAGGMEFETNTASPIRFFTSGSSSSNERMRVTPNGYIGVGTTNPGSLLEVNGSITLSRGSNGGIIFPNGQSQTVPYIPSTASTPITGVWSGAPLTSGSLPADVVYTDSQQQVISGQMSFSNSVAIGSTVPIVTGGGSNSVSISAANFPEVYYQSLNSPQDETLWRTIVRHDSSDGHAQWQLETLNDADSAEVVAMNVSRNGPSVSSVSFPNGNVGIGTSSPGAALEINGNVKLTSGSGASVTFPDGTVQSTAWNGTTLGGDYAESVDVLGARGEYEPGDLIAIDTASPGKFTKTGAAYSKLVAGVYSTKPGLVGRRSTYARPDKADEVPMAMMGIVPVKVSTENGPIAPGDLLVSSATLGYAMKGTDRDRLTGAVIGKALAPLTLDKGVIEVLLALQ